MNTTGFKHFKLHSDSTLKSMRKDKLIEYIHMLYHNWQGTDESFMNISIYAEKLSEKEKPKKPELVDVRFRQRGRRYGELVTLEACYKCPNCRTHIFFDCDDKKYCASCGQRLDWSKKNE